MKKIIDVLMLRGVEPEVDKYAFSSPVDNYAIHQQL